MYVEKNKITNEEVFQLTTTEEKESTVRKQVKNTEIIDFFTHKSFEEITTKNYKQNDQLTKKYGVYLGCLRKTDSDRIRKIISELEFKCEQINHLTAEWEELFSEYQELLDHCLKILFYDTSTLNKVDKIEDNIMISEDGHVWVLDTSKIKHF